MKCLLDKDINKCPYFLSTEKECTAKSSCTYQEKIGQPTNNSHIRKERWYEKYYKKS